MRVRMKVDISGARNGKPWPPRGGTMDLPDAEGAQLCAVGIAEPVRGPGVETAVMPAVETAMMPQHGVEYRALTTEAAAPSEHGAEQRAGLTTATGPVRRAPAKKAAAKKAVPRKTAAKKTAAAEPEPEPAVVAPEGDSDQDDGQ